MEKTVKKKQNHNQEQQAAAVAASESALHKSSLAFVAVLIVLLGILSFERNFIWDTKLSLWTDVAAKSPLKSRAHNNLGNCYALLGRLFEAIEEYKIALSLNKKNIEAYYNLGMYLEEVGILNQAVYYYDIFCKAAPPLYAEQKLTSCRRAEELSRKIRSR
jgi:tetratricopeptide (TPR) repeat protein